MSVFAKIKQYGAMRAVGMDKRQITKMIILLFVFDVAIASVYAPFCFL